MSRKCRHLVISIVKDSRTGWRLTAAMKSSGLSNAQGVGNVTTLYVLHQFWFNKHRKNKVTSKLVCFMR